MYEREDIFLERPRATEEWLERKLHVKKTEKIDRFVDYPNDRGHNPFVCLLQRLEEECEVNHDLDGDGGMLGATNDDGDRC